MGEGVTDRRLECFSLDSAWVSGSEGARFDASYYNPRAAHAIETLKRSGLTIKPLGEVTQRIFIPPRFKRIYVGPDQGIPFLQGSHVVHFQPADLKYVSKTAHKDLGPWLIHSGWLLVTRSGTIGRVTIAADRWDGWAASEHIMRVVPDPASPCLPGYIYAFLNSPIGQAQLTARIYGAVVDEITEDHGRGVLIPVPTTAAEVAQVKTINDQALKAIMRLSEAAKLADESVQAIDRFIPALPLVEAAKDDLTPFERFQNLTQQVLSVPHAKR